MNRTTYVARAQRSGRWWAITVDGVSGLHSQARRLSQVESMARDALGTFFDVAQDSFDVEVRPALEEEERHILEQVERARRDAEAAQSAVQMAMVYAAQFLVQKEGMTLRDAGQLMGVSFQRVDQLLKTSA